MEAQAADLRGVAHQAAPLPVARPEVQWGLFPGTTAPSAGSAGAGTSAISGAPNGPQNPAGLNNSLNDPSGAANASTPRNVPGTNAAGTANSGGSPGNASGEALHLVAPSQLGQQVTEPVARSTGRIDGTVTPGGPSTPADAVISRENAKVDQKVKSICKGC